MAHPSAWVRPLVWLAALAAMCLPLLGSAEDDATLPEQEAVAALLRGQEEAWNRGDLAGFMAAYARTDDLVFASGGTVTRGWETVRERYRARYGAGEAMGRLRFSLEQIDVLGTGWAKVLGRWELERGDDHPRGLFTLVLRRQEEGWRILHDHTSVAQDLDQD